MKIAFRKAVLFSVLAAFSFWGVACSSGGENKETTTEEAPTLAEEPAAAPAEEGIGVGPVTKVEIPASIDKDLAATGQGIFESKCTACHNTTDQKKVGPGLAGVTQRRKPEWVMNMILNPEQMVKEDPTAQELLATYMAPMANQSLTEDQARAVYEYFRTVDAGTAK